MKRTLLSVMLVLICTSFVCAQSDWRSGIPWEEPKKIDAGEPTTTPPSDAIILFDGTDLSAWDNQQWVVEDGIVTVKPGSGSMSTKQKFGSVQLHIEFATPACRDTDNSDRDIRRVYDRHGPRRRIWKNRESAWQPARLRDRLRHRGSETACSRESIRRKGYTRRT